ncbi:hypothetical protein ABTO68_19450, partial [Acinetobacter baumannii]
HVVLTDPAPVAANGETGRAPEILLLSAQSRAALNDLALDYAARLDGAAPEDAARVAAAAFHRRERLSTRLALPIASGTDVPAALRALA